MRHAQRPSGSDRTPALMKAGGFAVVDRIPGGTKICGALFQEALALTRCAERQEHDIDAASDMRGGLPARRLFSSPGGDVLAGLYADRRFQDFVAEIVGMPVSAAGFQGSYSYYVRPGDHLGLHRDIEECDVAVISCLCDTGGSGVLQVYPERLAEPLSCIRSTPEKGRVSVQLRPGQTVVLLGGHVPHVTTPMERRQRRIISALCYAARG